MTARAHLGFVAAAATLFATAPLSTIFESWTWLGQCAIAIVLVAGTAAITRVLRAPTWAQLITMVGALLLALTWMFPSGEEFFTVLPTPATIGNFGTLLAQSAEDVHRYGIPVPDGDTLLFITVLGVGSVAIVVDVLTVALGRPALAGLPMLAIYSVPVAIYIDSVPPLPFVIGAIGFLWLLMADNVDRVRRFGRRFSGDGRDVDVWEASPLAAAGRRLALVGVVLAVLVPVAIPGMTAGLLTNLSTGGVNGQGLGTGSGQVNLFAALSGQLNQSEVTEMVRVTTTDTTPAYLRIGIADEISAGGFASQPPRGRPASARTMRDPREDPELRRTGVTHEAFRATVEITDSFNMALLPTYATPIATENVGDAWAYDTTAQVIFSDQARSRGFSYSFEYVRSSYTTTALRRSRPLAVDDPIRQRFTPVPDVPEVTALVADLTRDADSDYDRVRAIYEHFSRDNGFTYSLATEGGTASEDIVNFLDNKVGFCQQYAAALAWLVRAADIPARVAFGFTNGARRLENTYILTNLNLHAWVEVYFEGLGWVPFDATPAANVPGSVRSGWAPDVNAPDPGNPVTPPTTPPGGDRSAEPPPDRPPGNVNEGFLPGGGATGPTDLTWLWWVSAGGVLLFGLLMLPALRRSAVRRRRLVRAVAAPAPTPPGGRRAPAMTVTVTDPHRSRDHAHAVWAELIDTMIDFRVPVDQAETPRATAERLGAVGPVREFASDAILLLGQAEERARYAREPLPGGPSVDALRAVRRALAAGARRRTRLVARVLPPSVLLHWRRGVMDAYGRAASMVSRWRDLVVRWSPRRLLTGRFGR